VGEHNHPVDRMSTVALCCKDLDSLLFLVKEGARRDWLKSGTYARYIFPAIKNRYTTDMQVITLIHYYILSYQSLG
jgi:hypothetical protein